MTVARKAHQKQKQHGTRLVVDFAWCLLEKGKTPEDRCKFAGLEALVPEELEKHLILNSTRLRTFEDARLEVVKYVEAKFGSSIRDSTPSDTVTRGPSDPMDLDAVNSLSSKKRNSASSPRDGLFEMQ